MPNKTSSPIHTNPLVDSKQALRQQAEEIIIERAVQPLVDTGMLSYEEMQRKLQELHVHQIELEIQNEELQRVHAELDAERKRYFNLYDLAPVGYCSISDSGIILETNHTITKMLGEVRGALIKQTFSQLIYREDRKSYFLLIKRLYETGELQEHDLRIVRKDETTLWTHLSAIVAQDTDGTRKCLVALTDITNTKNAEDALKESEEENRQIIEQSRDAIVISDSNGKIITWNKAMETISDIKRCYAINNNIWDLQYQLTPVEMTSPAYATFLKTQYMNMVDKSNHWQGQRLEQTIALANGTVKIMEASSFLIDTQNRVLWASNFHDITDRKLIEEELRTAKEAAEASSIAKSQFLANMSHEIRTPMTSIIGMTDLTLNTELTEEQRLCLTILKSSTRALMKVLNAILDYSKIEAGKVNLDKDPFDIREMLQEVVDLFQGSAKQKNINIGLNSIDHKIPRNLIGDSIRLKQVLLNLVDNAIKYTNQGEVTLSMDLVEQANSTILLTFIVSDSGIGIPEDKLDRLFKRFSRLDDSNTREVGGTGLGLAISKKLIELMGGDIYVDSKEGVGSKFCFTTEFRVQKKDAKLTLNDDGIAI